jgi:hypothetical protein
MPAQTTNRPTYRRRVESLEDAVVLLTVAATRLD